MNRAPLLVRRLVALLIRMVSGPGSPGRRTCRARDRDGRLHCGRTGVAWLVLRSGAPVVPVGLIGTERIRPVGAQLQRIRRVGVRFGRPLRFAPDPHQRPATQRRAITDRIVAAIGDLTGQERANGLSVGSGG